MIEKIEYLISLTKPNGETGKLILRNRDGNYQAEWTYYSMDVEETHVQYAGSDLKTAWQALEKFLCERITEGYRLNSPFIRHLLNALPPRLTLFRKLECFAAQHANPTLFQDLKKWRKETSNTNHIPPYFIGTDKLLSLLSTFIPHTQEQLMQIPGIGQQKCSQYGLDILERTKRYEQPFPYPLLWIHEKVNEDTLAIWMILDKEGQEARKKIRLDKEREDKLRLLEMIEAEVSIQEMTQHLDISLPVLLVKIKDLAKEGYEVVNFLQKEVNTIQERDMISDIVSTLGSNRLKPIYEKIYGASVETSGKDVGERYDRIRLVCMYLQLKQAS